MDAHHCLGLRRQARDLQGPVAGSDGMADRRLHVPDARPLDRLEAGAAVPVAWADRQQHHDMEPMMLENLLCDMHRTGAGV